jgi:hypothetical protein
MGPMPRLRIRIPLDIDVEKETLDAVGALGEVIAKAQKAGLPDALARVVSSTRDAMTARRRRRHR